MMYIREGARLRISVGGGMGYEGKGKPLRVHSDEGVKPDSQEMKRTINNRELSAERHETI